VAYKSGKDFYPDSQGSIIALEEGDPNLLIDQSLLRRAAVEPVGRE
jgi:hypothetical protein